MKELGMLDENGRHKEQTIYPHLKMSKLQTKNTILPLSTMIDLSKLKMSIGEEGRHTIENQEEDIESRFEGKNLKYVEQNMSKIEDNEFVGESNIESDDFIGEKTRKTEDINMEMEINIDQEDYSSANLILKPHFELDQKLIQRVRCGRPPPSFRILKQNLYRGKMELYKAMKNIPVDESPHQLCSCTPLTGCGLGCMNRQLFMECQPDVCPSLGPKSTTKYCANTIIQQKLASPTEVFETENGRGWGLRCTKALTRKSIVIEYMGEVLTREEAMDRMENTPADSDFYFASLGTMLGQNLMLDAGPMGSNARFANHSCDPNCELQKWKVNNIPHIVLVTLRDLEEGEEITYNYQVESLKGAFGRQECRCGSKNCSGFLGLRPLLKQENVLVEKKNQNTRNDIIDRSISKVDYRGDASFFETTEESYLYNSKEEIIEEFENQISKKTPTFEIVDALIFSAKKLVKADASALKSSSLVPDFFLSSTSEVFLDQISSIFVLLLSTSISISMEEVFELLEKYYQAKIWRIEIFKKIEEKKKECFSLYTSKNKAKSSKSKLTKKRGLSGASKESSSPWISIEVFEEYIAAAPNSIRMREVSECKKLLAKSKSVRATLKRLNDVLKGQSTSQIVKSNHEIYDCLTSDNKKTSNDPNYVTAGKNNFDLVPSIISYKNFHELLREALCCLPIRVPNLEYIGQILASMEKWGTEMCNEIGIKLKDKKQVGSQKRKISEVNDTGGKNGINKAEETVDITSSFFTDMKSTTPLENIVPYFHAFFEEGPSNVLAWTALEEVGAELSRLWIAREEGIDDTKRRSTERLQQLKKLVEDNVKSKSRRKAKSFNSKKNMKGKNENYITLHPGGKLPHQKIIDRYRILQSQKLDEVNIKIPEEYKIAEIEKNCITSGKEQKSKNENTLMVKDDNTEDPTSGFTYIEQEKAYIRTLKELQVPIIEVSEEAEDGEDPAQDVFCFCMLPEHEGIDSNRNASTLILCDSCKEWYHPVCVKKDWCTKKENKSCFKCPICYIEDGEPNILLISEGDTTYYTKNKPLSVIKKIVTSAAKLPICRSDTQAFYSCVLHHGEKWMQKTNHFLTRFSHLINIECSFDEAVLNNGHTINMSRQDQSFFTLQIMQFLSLHRSMGVLIDIQTDISLRRLLWIITASSCLISNRATFQILENTIAEGEKLGFNEGVHPDHSIKDEEEVHHNFLVEDGISEEGHLCSMQNRKIPLIEGGLLYEKLRRHFTQGLCWCHTVSRLPFRYLIKYWSLLVVLKPPICMDPREEYSLLRLCFALLRVSDKTVKNIEHENGTKQSIDFSNYFSEKRKLSNDTIFYIGNKTFVKSFDTTLKLTNKSRQDDLAFTKIFSICPLLSKMNQQYRILVEDCDAIRSECEKERNMASETKSKENKEEQALGVSTETKSRHTTKAPAKSVSELYVDSSLEKAYSLKAPFDSNVDLRTPTSVTLNRMSTYVYSMTKIDANLSYRKEQLGKASYAIHQNTNVGDCFFVNIPVSLKYLNESERLAILPLLLLRAYIKPFTNKFSSALTDKNTTKVDNESTSLDQVNVKGQWIQSILIKNEKEYCICLGGEVRKENMVECDGCKRWFHFSCVHYSASDKENSTSKGNKKRAHEQQMKPKKSNGKVKQNKNDLSDIEQSLDSLNDICLQEELNSEIMQTEEEGIDSKVITNSSESIIKMDSKVESKEMNLLCISKDEKNSILNKNKHDIFIGKKTGDDSANRRKRIRKPPIKLEEVGEDFLKGGKQKRGKQGTKGSLIKESNTGAFLCIGCSGMENLAYGHKWNSPSTEFLLKSSYHNLTKDEVRASVISTRLKDKQSCIREDFNPSVESSIVNASSFKSLTPNTDSMILKNKESLLGLHQPPENESQETFPSTRSDGPDSKFFTSSPNENYTIHSKDRNALSVHLPSNLHFPPNISGPILNSLSSTEVTPQGPLPFPFFPSPLPTSICNPSIVFPFLSKPLPDVKQQLLQHRQQSAPMADKKMNKSDAP